MSLSAAEEDVQYQKEFDQVVKLLGGKCYKCGSTEDLLVTRDISGLESDDSTDSLLYNVQHLKGYYLTCFEHLCPICDDPNL